MPQNFANGREIQENPEHWNTCSSTQFRNSKLAGGCGVVAIFQSP
jgi:hypothetical protein